ncbi:prolyl oligopeptidase family serine peptidase [Paraburkholderia sp. 2C]
MPAKSAPTISLWPPSDGPDPYLALEALDDPAVATWVDAQRARTIDAFGRGARVDALTRRLAAAFTSQAQLVVCSRWGTWAYNTWVDDAHPLAVVRRTRWDAWLQGRADWEIVLDVGAIDINDADAGDTRWVLQDVLILYPDADRGLVLLSPDGSDACIVKEFDIEARAFVADGFNLPVAGAHEISWIDRDTVYVAWDDSTVNGDANLSACGQPVAVRKWARGSAVENAPVVFACSEHHLSATAWYDPLSKRHLAVRSTTRFQSEQFWLDEYRGEWRQYDVPPDAEIREWNGWLIVTLRAGWDAGCTVYPSGSLLVIGHDAFVAGARDFTVLFAPRDRQALVDVACTRNWIAVSSSNDGTTHIVRWQAPAAADAGWQSHELPLPAASEVSVTPVDCVSDDTVLIHVSHFLMPPALFHADPGSGEPWMRLSQLPPLFDASGLTATRCNALAADGTLIPYWVIGPAADSGDTPRPCMLQGYGGFGVSMDAPDYVHTDGFAWLERGGVMAIACTRGGGEFGPAWHKAALRENRQVAFDDFIAVAQALIATGVTTPKQLGIVGASNGGLLTAACMIQRPDLFGAVVSDIPLLDMARFHLLLQGAAWIEEYGDPDDANDLRYLLRYSPYANVAADTHYPPVLFVTSTTDDRVHPGHARKMTAKMHALGHHAVWLLEHKDGGHGGGALPETFARTQAIVREFLWSTLTQEPGEVPARV